MSWARQASGITTIGLVGLLGWTVGLSRPAQAQAPASAATPAPAIPVPVATLPPDMKEPAPGAEPMVAPPVLVQSGPLATTLESLLGDVYADGSWHPLSFSGFFTEGWDEAWACAPAGGEGLTPRHGWLGAFNGVFYRLWVTTFSFQPHLAAPAGGNRYLGDFAIFLPFNRRFEVLIESPFVVSKRGGPANTYQSGYGDLSIVPRFMLSESERLSQVFGLVIRTPTGQKDNGNGLTALTPRYDFWANPFGPWVVRGSVEVNVPIDNSTTRTSLIGGLAAGYYLRPHDVPFGDLVFYTATNFNVPLGDRASTYVGIGPGTRFHIADNYFFLSYCEFPVTTQKPDDCRFEVALVKVF